ncbi:phage tail tube protein [Vibrio furnissii]|uniref:phage tail tube protein n=1 Tax=Vibrio furnissii TaxID=29494 RepID=UPI001EEC1019|nr:phage tail tube protein [Vibrio furnissii]MCG6216272.1 phage tail protein [Vibrio furnissii]
MTFGMIPVAGKGNKVLVLKKASTIEEAMTAAATDMGSELHWDSVGYLAAITPPTMTKEVSTENYLDSDDGYGNKSSGTKDAGELGFQLGYAPGQPVQQRLVDLYDVANGEKEKWWYAIKSPTEEPGKYVINMYYGILNSLGTPTSIENSADMKRDIKIALEGRPKLAEDFLRAAAA